MSEDDTDLTVLEESDCIPSADVKVRLNVKRSRKRQHLYTTITLGANSTIPAKPLTVPFWTAN
jgi:hypothetical protein